MECELSGGSGKLINFKSLGQFFSRKQSKRGSLVGTFMRCSLKGEWADSIGTYSEYSKLEGQVFTV